MSIRQAARQPLLLVEGLFSRVFGAEANPFHYLGALTIFFFWIVLVTGIYLFVFFKTSVYGAYESVEYLTHTQWYLGGVMRSLHRYASDAAVITMMIHLLREFVNDRYRGFRWYSWFTGMPLIWFVFLLGITGYWLVWDELAQYVAIASSELLDALPIFTDPMARNFLSESSVSDRFFTLMGFLHLLGLPVIIVFAIWFHVLRIARPKVNPPRELAIGTFAALLALSFAKPAVSHAPANLAVVPNPVQLDWFYLNLYPLLDVWPPMAVWGLLWGLSLLLAIAPWLPPLRKKSVAVVDPANCNGCGRCFADCPYSAITLTAHPTRAGMQLAVVDADLCASCGICAGACPSSTPFRSTPELVSGIDMPQLPVQAVRARTKEMLAGLSGEGRVMVFGCDHAANVASLRGEGVAAVSLECIGQLPPSFIDYVLRDGRCDGVLLTGCHPESCHYRFGSVWTEQRLRHEREPHLRTRAAKERLHVVGAGAGEEARLAKVLARYRAALRMIPPPGTRPAPAESAERKVHHG